MLARIRSFETSLQPPHNACQRHKYAASVAKLKFSLRLIILPGQNLHPISIGQVLISSEALSGSDFSGSETFALNSGT
jgi:hypothetical protein